MADYEASPQIDESEMVPRISPQYAKRRIKTRCSVCVIILIALFIVLFLKNYQYIGSRGGIDASLRPSQKTCGNIYSIENKIYGCCEIVDETDHTFILPLHRVVKRNPEGTNCPTYNRLIYNYIEYIETFPTYFNVRHNITEPCNINNITLPLGEKHCPSTYTMVLAYGNKYESPYSDFIICGMAVIIFLCIMTL